MIFDLLAPPQDPRGRGQKKCAVARLTHVSNSHTKFGWILSNGLGGDSVTDGQTDWGDCNIPNAFLKSMGSTSLDHTVFEASMARGPSTEPTILSQDFWFGYDTALTKLTSVSGVWHVWHITEAHYISPGMSIPESVMHPDQSTGQWHV